MHLPVEDRWLLSRLSTVTKQVTECIEHYRYAEASRILYDFAWDEFCSFYVEIAKPRLSDPDKRAVSQSVMAHGLDTLLRLLHPTMPFVTEAIWECVNDAGRQRGVPDPSTAGTVCDDCSVARGRCRVTMMNRSNVSSLNSRRSSVRFDGSERARRFTDRETVPVVDPLQHRRRSALLDPMRSYFEGLAGAEIVTLGPDAKPFETDAPLALTSIDVDVHVDLEKFIDCGRGTVAIGETVDSVGQADHRKRAKA